MCEEAYGRARLCVEGRAQRLFERRHGMAIEASAEGRSWRAGRLGRLGCAHAAGLKPPFDGARGAQCIATLNALRQ